MGEIAKTVRIPAVVDLQMELFDMTTVPSSFSSYMKNMVADKINERLVARVRPPIERIIATPPDTKGRGIYHWERNLKDYHVNGATVLSDFVSIGTITSSHRKVYFTEVGNRIFLTDPANSQAWTIQTNDTLTRVTSSAFPTTLAHGAESLNGRGYVMDTAGAIYSSALEDATAWSALDVVEAERSGDSGVFITKHHDHIVAFGSSTIEFFYDAANPTGSPLTRREDVMYNIGAYAGDCFWTFQDVTYFIGRASAGSLGLYKLENFQLTKLSKYDIDVYIAAVGADPLWYVSGFQGFGKTFVLLNLADSTSTYANSSITFAYDIDAGIWSLLSTAFDGAGALNKSFPVVAWAGREGESSGGLSRGIFPSGHVIQVRFSGFTDFESPSTNNAIDVAIRTGWQDGGTNKYKYCRSLECVYNVADDTTATITYTDTDNFPVGALSVSRTLSLLATFLKRKLTRLGRFVRRNWQISASVSDELIIEAIELEVALGDV